MSVITISGERHLCQGTGVVHVQLPSGMYAFVEALVVFAKPLNFNFIVGRNSLEAFHGITVHTRSDVWFDIDGFAFCSAVWRS